MEMIDRQIKILLLALDVTFTLSCFCLIYFLRMSPDISILFQSLGMWTIVGVNVVFIYIFGGYDLAVRKSRTQVWVQSLVSLGCAIVIIIFINYLAGKDRTHIFGRGVFFGAEFVFALLSIIYRLRVQKIFFKLKSFSQWLFITSADNKAHLDKDLEKNKVTGQFSILSPEDWLSSSAQNLSSNLILATNKSDIQSLNLGSSLMSAKFQGRRIMDLSEFYESQLQKVPIFYLDPTWFITSQGFSIVHNRNGLRFKRLFDIFCSVLLILITWPIMLMAAIAIKLESQGPALYSQVRTGKDDKKFVIYKFRSMRTDAEKDGAKWAAANDSRITRVGNFIRKTRIDELPQLFNVLKGQMSFVGPRPERPEFNEMLAKEIPFYGLRHLVLPGITGWAQILYPYGASVEDAKEKLQYELYYIKNYSFFMDLIVILKTVRVVLFGYGR